MANSHMAEHFVEPDNSSVDVEDTIGRAVLADCTDQVFEEDVRFRSVELRQLLGDAQDGVSDGAFNRREVCDARVER